MSVETNLFVLTKPELKSSRKKRHILVPFASDVMFVISPAQFPSERVSLFTGFVVTPLFSHR